MTTMRPIRETIPMDEAKALLMESAIPIERIERITIRDAADRVLASPRSPRSTCRRSIARRWTVTR